MTRHAQHAAPRRRAAWRPLAAAAVGAAVLSVGGQGVWAALSATATTTTPQTAGTGTLSLTMAANGAGFTQAVSAVAPGDVVHRYVDLTSGGTLAAQDLTLSIASTGSTVLRTDAVRGLRVSVASCSVAWTGGTCTGTRSALVNDVLLGTLATPAPLAATVAPGALHRLQVSLRLPDTDETTTNGAAPAGTVQGQTASLTYTFAEVQRTATTSSS